MSLNAKSGGEAAVNSPELEHELVQAPHWNYLLGMTAHMGPLREISEASRIDLCVLFFVDEVAILKLSFKWLQYISIGKKYISLGWRKHYPSSNI